ncbi:MAG: TIM barrel protein [Lachnospiraceae bacterium]|nr:TIM barrel protein [Lachnospiraceae bacterium]
MMKVGIQLYSVRNHMAENPMDTIRKVANEGYRYIEVANHNADKDAGVGFGISAEETKALLKETGAQIFSAHIFPLDPAQMTPILEFHKEIGTKYFVQPMDFYKDKDETLRKAEMLNKVGERCKEYGMQLLYHNHFHEFQHFGDETIFELLMKHTDPELVKIELDTYWTTRGQQDPVELLKKYGKRVCLVHQKDFTKGYEAERDLLASVEATNDYVDMDRFNRDVKPETFTEIGTGIMDIQSIIDAANTYCASEAIVLEQDYSQHDELESIRISMESFKRFKGVEW